MFASDQRQYFKEKKFQMMKYQAGKVQVGRRAAVQGSFPGAVIQS